MVKTRSKNNLYDVTTKATKEMISIFGRSLTLRRITRTLNNDGELVSTSTSDTVFTGDLQFGLDLDQRYLKAGIVEVGEAVLYLHPNELSTIPSLRDKIIDGNSVWRITDILKSPELGGSVTHYEFKCVREPENNDS